MPSYSWLCDSCKIGTEVVRKMSDIELGPDNGCENCGNTNLKRTINIDPKSRNVIWKCDGNHDSLYTKTRPRN